MKGLVGLTAKNMTNAAKATLKLIVQLKNLPANTVSIVTLVAKKSYNVVSTNGRQVIATVRDGVFTAKAWATEKVRVVACNILGKNKYCVGIDKRGRAKICNKKGECFVAGTLVLTKEGYKKIEDIEVGDWVWSFNEATGKKELRKVLKTFVRKTHQLVYLYLGKKTIKTTVEHPFYVRQEVISFTVKYC